MKAQRNNRKILLIGFAAALIVLASACQRIPEPTGTKYQYDNEGRITRRTGPGGKVTRYEYNQFGQPTRISYSGQAVRLDYDSTNNLVLMEDWLGRTRYGYDKPGRLSEVTTPSGKRLSYSYDPWGHVQSITMPDGHQVSFEYDLLDNIVLLDDGKDAVVRYEYQGDKNRVVRHLPNGIITIYESSPLGQLVLIRHQRADGSLIAAYRYAYDHEGRVSTVEEEVTQKKETTSYEYDLLRRLVRITTAGAVIAYTYDALGNRTAQSDSTTGSIAYEYDSEGHLVKAGNIVFTCDAAGNVSSKKEGSLLTTYNWDDANRLVEVRRGDTKILYTYDGEGNLVRREVNGKEVIHYLHHRGALPQVLAEYSASGNLLRRHLLGSSRLAQQDANGQTIWLLEDRLGSTRLVVDAAGKVIASYAYSPFGIPTLTEGTPQTDFLFTGEQWDPDAQLLYLRNRYYDPQVGRFLSVDPLPGSPANPQSFNRYPYGENDPINKHDPAGLQASWYTPWQAYYDPNRYLRPLRQDGLPLQLFPRSYLPPVPLTPFDRLEMRYGLDRWRNPGSYTRLPSPSSRPELPLDTSNNKWWKILPSMTLRSVERGEFLYADTPWQRDVRSFAHALEFAPPPLTPLRPVGKGFDLLFSISDARYLSLHGDKAGAGLKLFGQGSEILLDRALPGNKQVGGWLGNVAKGTDRLDTIVDFSENFWGGNLRHELGSLSSAFSRQFQQARDPLDTLALFDPFIAGSLNETRDIFFPPPPGGGGGTVPSVGGVYLDQTAKVIGELGEIKGAAYDPRTGQLVLVGDKDTSLPPLKPEYLAAAIKAVYSESPHEPGMTIDPHPQNPHAPIMVVRFFGNTENTRLGWVMFEADRLLKGYSIGIDNISKQFVASAVSDYQSITSMGLSDPNYKSGLWSRFWLVPETVTARLSEDGRSIFFDPIELKVHTETMRWAEQKLVPAGNIKDPHAETFAEHFSTHYEEFVRENPVFAELKVVTQAVALAKWMKEQGVPVDWNFVRIFGRPFETPTTTPAAHAAQRKTMSDGRGIRTLTVTAFGGVDMNPAIAGQKEQKATALAENLNTAWMSAKQEGKASFSFEFEKKHYQAVALPSSHQKELASYNLTEVDIKGLPSWVDSLPGLSRSYNSFHNELSEFGFSWSLRLPHLEFEAAGQKGQSGYMSVEGNPASRVLLQRFILTNAFGTGQEQFTEHFVDQEFRRIGFKPDSGSSHMRGIYPEEDAYRLIFANTEQQALFDRTGKLRAVLAPEGKAIYEYTGAGLLSSIRFLQGKDEAQVRFEYDTENRITAVVSDNTRVTYEYDTAGNLSTVKKGDVVISYHYDERKLLTEVAMNGQAVVQNTYDQVGRLVTQRDLQGRQSKQSVEPKADGGKIVTLKRGEQFLKRQYDSQLRLAKVEDSEGNSREYSYGGDGRLTNIEATLPTIGRARVEFSPEGKKTTVQDLRGIQTEYRYFQNNKLSEVRIDQESYAAYRYEPRGELAEVKYAEGAEQYAYDSSGRVSQYRRITAGNHARAEQIMDFHYDSQGMLSSISSPTMGSVRFVQQKNALSIMRGKDSSTYRYDEKEGRLLNVEGSEGKSNYSYRPDGSLNKVEMSLGDHRSSVEVVGENAVVSRSTTDGETKYLFTSTGQLASIEGPYGDLTSYSYDDEGRLTKIHLPNGSCLIYRFAQESRQVSEERLGACSQSAQ